LKGETIAHDAQHQVTVGSAKFLSTGGFNSEHASTHRRICAKLLPAVLKIKTAFQKDFTGDSREPTSKFEAINN